MVLEEAGAAAVWSGGVPRALQGHACGRVCAGVCLRTCACRHVHVDMCM